MGTAPVKAIALPGANLEFQSHVPFQHSRTRSRIRARVQGFTHARTPRFLHFSAFIVPVFKSGDKSSASATIDLFHSFVLFQKFLKN